METSTTVEVTLNFMGVSVERGFAKAAKQGKLEADTSVELSLAESVLGLSLDAIPEDVLERYERLSTKELYLPFLPYSEKFFERLLLPFKSAKRCFCLGEYLASIELCAHVGEMLAQLVWEMAPIFNADNRTDSLERAILGSTFEKLGQERRIRILLESRRISEPEKNRFDDVRTTRRKYFHIWSEGVSSIEEDAYRCFVAVHSLIKDILQIKLSDGEPGKVTVNPRLSQYLDREKRKSVS